MFCFSSNFDETLWSCSTRVSQMCQKFTIPISKVIFPLLTSSPLYNDQNFVNIWLLNFGWSGFCVSDYRICCSLCAVALLVRQKSKTIFLKLTLTKFYVFLVLIWQGHKAMPYGKAIWQSHMAKPYGNDIWQSHMAKKAIWYFLFNE